MTGIPQGRSHRWYADGDALRCSVCGMRSIWAGARHSCTGVDATIKNERQGRHYRKAKAVQAILDRARRAS